VIAILILFINAISQLLVLLIIVSVILAYFMELDHPIRRAIDGVVEPMLSPIRRIVPLVGMIDFSPLVLILLIQLLSNILVRVLSTLR
jgi:YggT family protein